MENWPLARYYIARGATERVAVVSLQSGVLQGTVVAASRFNWQKFWRDATQTGLSHRTTPSHKAAIRGLWCLMDTMAQALSTHREAPSGLLRLCSSSGFERPKLGPALAALAKRYPQLELQQELLDRPVDLVGECFHLDIRLGHVQEPHLISRRIAHNQRVLCAAHSYVAQHGAPRACKI
jgi:hypothetical protein